MHNSLEIAERSDNDSSSRGPMRDTADNVTCSPCQESSEDSSQDEDDGPFKTPKNNPDAAQRVLKYRQLRMAMRANLAAGKPTQQADFFSSLSTESFSSFMSARSLNIDGSDELNMPLVAIPKMRTIFGQMVMQSFASTISEEGFPRTASSGIIILSHQSISNSTFLHNPFVHVYCRLRGDMHRERF